MSQVNDLLTRLRRDPRVDYVVRAFLAQRLGLTTDEFDGYALNAVLATPLEHAGASVTYAIGAAQLLERLDAQLARAHPVDLDYLPTGVVVARVLTDEEETLTVALDHDYRPAPPGDAPTPSVATLLLERDDEHVAALTVDDAESLAYALLRLVRVAREAASATSPTEEAPS